MALAEIAAEGGMIRDMHNVRVRETDEGEIVNFHGRVDPALAVQAVHEKVDEVERALAPPLALDQAGDRPRRAAAELKRKARACIAARALRDRLIDGQLDARFLEHLGQIRGLVRDDLVHLLRRVGHANQELRFRAWPPFPAS